MDALWLLVVCAGYPKKLRNLTNVGRVLGHKEDLARLQVVDAIDPFLHGVLLKGKYAWGKRASPLTPVNGGASGSNVDRTSGAFGDFAAGSFSSSYELARCSCCADGRQEEGKSR